MQYPIPWRSGCKKPFGSLPRINTQHPLARGLASYCFDCGGGVLIDLVGGGQGKQVIAGSPAGVPLMTTTRYGQNWELIGQATGNGTGTTSDNFEFPFNARTDNMANSAPYAFACGLVYQSKNDVSSFYSICDSSSNQHFEVGLFTTAGSAQPSVFFGNTGAPVNLSNNYTVGAFTTIVGTVSGVTGTAWRFDDAGGFDTSAASVTFTSNTGLVPVFGDNVAGTGVTLHSNAASGQVFYGAAWAGRNITLSEATQLAADPWSLLWYPEDDIFSTLGPAVSTSQFLIPQQVILM